MAKKSANETFQSSWNKAVAWAQTQGIDTKSIAPVFQLDQQRLASGESIMSAAERNRAILAADNPNNVTPSSSDTPSPTSILGNLRNNLASIVTGIPRIPQGIFDSVKNTVEFAMDPAKAKGANADATAANWMQDTILGFIPGVADVGSYLKAGGGKAGLDVLAENPISSLIDLAPAGKWLDAGLAKTALGESVAAKAGMSTAQLANHGPALVMAKAIGNLRPGGRFASEGVSATGRLADNLSISDRLGLMLQHTPIGSKESVGKLGQMLASGSQLATEIQRSQFAPFAAAFSALSETDQATFAELFRRHALGENIVPLLIDRSTPMAVREAALSLLRGPQRWIADESILATPGDVAAVRMVDGSMAMYATKGTDDAVVKARDQLFALHPEVVRSFGETDALLTKLKKLDDAKPKLADNLDKTLAAARQVMAKDESLLGNVKRAYTDEKGKARIATSGTKLQAADALFAPGGFGDQVVKNLREGNDDQLMASVRAYDHRLTDWGAKSVDVAEMDPAYQAVRNEVAGLKRYAEQKAKWHDEVNQRIVGEDKATKAEVELRRAQRKQRTTQLQQRQTTERQNLRLTQRRALNKIRVDRDLKLSQSDTRLQQFYATEDRLNANAKLRATAAQAKEIDRQTAYQKASFKDKWLTSKAQTRNEFAGIEREAKLQQQIDKTNLEKVHADELRDLTDRHNSEQYLDGVMAHEVQSWTDALDKFNQTIYDHPPANYRDMYMVEYEKALLAQDATAQEVMKYKIAKDELKPSAVERIRSDPNVIREYVSLAFRDLFKNVQAADPGLVEAAEEARQSAIDSAHEEINKLVVNAKGPKPMWLPAADASDRLVDRIGPKMGGGVPHVDAAFDRSFDTTATRHDVVLGLNKALAQVLRRDMHIELADQMISSFGTTGEDLNKFMGRHGLIEGYDFTVGKLPHAIEDKLSELGLEKFDPNSAFNAFSFPKYAEKNIYMPKGIAKALKQYMDQENKRVRLPTKAFRFSILNLSPRYTAHIGIGGTVMMALKSTPYWPKFIGEAARMLREGDMPTDVLGTPTQEGNLGRGEFTYTLRKHAYESGKQQGLLAVQSELEEGMGIKLHAAKALDFLKAAGQVNMKFTHYMVALQKATAYLDYFSKAEKKGFFEDPVTGERLAMTKERAMAEGKAHVLEVFGDMRLMTPFERGLSRNIVPFYGWQRHVLQYVLSFPVDDPWRAMVLSEVAFQQSEAVPKGLPERIQFLFNLGSPDAQGNVTAVDLRFMDPLRDVANYASWTGFFESLNPAAVVPLAMAFGPEAIYGSSSLYPNVTYNQFYGIETSGSQGSPIAGLAQFFPQATAIDDAYQAATNYRQLARSNPKGFAKQIFESLGIPGVPQTINVKQIAAHDELARYRVAEAAASNAFSSGDFGQLSGYSSVPNPLNPDYEITPDQLAAIYNASLAAYPGQAPSSVLLPPSSPAGF